LTGPPVRKPIAPAVALESTSVILTPSAYSMDEVVGLFRQVGGLNKLPS